MAVFHAVTFRDGDDVAVCLPDEIAFPADIDVEITRHGDLLVIRPAQTVALGDCDSGA